MEDRHSRRWSPGNRRPLRCSVTFARDAELDAPDPLGRRWPVDRGRIDPIVVPGGQRRRVQQGIDSKVQRKIPRSIRFDQKGLPGGFKGAEAVEVVMWTQVVTQLGIWEDRKQEKD